MHDRQKITALGLHALGVNNSIIVYESQEQRSYVALW